VEAVFSVNAGVRPARQKVYCIGGPAGSPRILAQIRLEPGETRKVRLSVLPGLLILRSYQSGGRVPLEVTESGSATLTVTCGAQLSVSSARMAAGGAEVLLNNTLSDECLLVFERETWRETAATAAIVSTIQEFRDLFPEEAVAPGQEIAVGRLAVLFTDLQGSTDLYERVGDVKAFDFVQSHFQYLLGLVAKHRGGVVKTMGDAIMAVFNSGLDAASAAVAMQEDWEAFVPHYQLPTQIRLKVGLHEGPAVVFNNKGAQDYFGTTVNMTARLQAQARGGEIVISQTVHDDPDVGAFLRSRFSLMEPFTAHLKGIAEDQPLYRLKLS
jgi:class 3 adenylate cyclase